MLLLLLFFFISCPESSLFVTVMNHSYISVSELPYEIHSCKRPDPVKDAFFSSRGCPLTRASTVLQFGKGVKHIEAVV